MKVDYLADTQPHRPWRPPQSRRGCALLAVLVALVLPLFLCGLTLVVYLVVPPPPTNILVLGVDVREPGSFASRADSIMLLGVNPGRLQVSLLSIPRDLFIEAPGYGLQRANTINFLGEQESAGGGASLMASSIEQSFGVRPHRYARLNFASFVELIDAVGGVTIDVERAIVDYNYPTENNGVMTVRFESGPQHMDGERALVYARTRYADDDYQRAGRQQQVVSALMWKLINPATWPAALGVVTRSVDTDLSLWDMLRLAPPVILSAGRFDQLVIDRDYILGTAQGYAVPNYDLIAPWLDGRFR